MRDPLRILTVLIILSGNAFFVAVEYALVTARRSHLGDRASRGDR